MGLQQLELRNVRRFSHYLLQPDPDAVTVLLSSNGTGKTTILEAVYALATAGSFRTSAASDMITTNATLAEVHGVVMNDHRRVGIDLTLARGARNVTKKMLVNGQRPRSRADLAAALPITIFTPEGVDMVRHGPDQRRAFLTTLITDVDLTSGEVVERFERTLRQRNALLRALRGVVPHGAERDELAVWTSDFVAASENLVAKRQRIVKEAAPLVQSYYEELAREGSQVGVRYEESWTGELGSALTRALGDDVHRGYTTLGPHRDDIVITLNGRDARRQASQGEQRCLALALRLAGHELVIQHRNVQPLLLLDDIFSELDPRRSDRLLSLLPVGQTLVTTASPLPSGLAAAAIVDVTKELT
ncbi:MAG: DNA replication and repair protein RecF [Actinomycetota bacterium]